ncbi:unnamed protein product [Phaeothamnion confervicola]
MRRLFNAAAAAPRHASSCSLRRRRPAAASLPSRSAATKAARQHAQGPALHPVGTALHLVRANARAKFDETVEVALRLGVDPRKPNQSVRSMVSLPHGIGKTIRVAVFARGAEADKAREAGADVVGAEDLVESMQNGNVDFDRCLATPDMMPLVGRIGRVLGPRGLMPNPKLGTVMRDIALAVRTAKAGQVQFKADKDGLVRAGIGKASFALPALLDNLRTFMVAVSNAKPEGAKGKYVRGMHLSSTMGKGYRVDPVTIDPGSSKFMAGGADPAVNAPAGEPSPPPAP